MRDLWDEFDVLVPYSSCECDEAKSYIDYLHQQRLLMFLMGQNESFSHVRSDILLKIETPSVNQAYATVVQEESQRVLGVLDSGKDTLTMMVGKTQTLEERNQHLKQQLVQPSVYEWIIDSGVTHYVTSCKELLNDLKQLVRQSANTVQLPTGNKAKIRSIWDSIILGNLTVKNVLHVPDFKFNLLSVAKLTKDLSCGVSFFLNFCVLQGLYSGKVIGIDREDKGLYVLKDEIKAVVGGAIKDINNTDLWHMRLGHPSLKAMQCISALKELVHTSTHHDCQTCPIAKQGRIAFPDSHSRSTSSFQFIHVDVWGPYKNGVVERKHRHILNTTRALRFQSGIPIRFWGHCVKTTTYLINKIPSAVLLGKSAYELLYGKEPKIDHLRVFGCLCFASVLPRVDKFAPRAKKTVLMGYSETQKGYRLLDLESNLFLVSRDVTFMEHGFSFKEPILSLDLLPHPQNTPISDYFMPEQQSSGAAAHP
ncbi:uncharacterized protein LOC129883678 [Solanum dulcamara]|uniref:uncharacterized protein LOC129883678 n=1 Tax=Solanum dulcamara TaxID=45834 RepID=UPI002484E0CC|nr:uncharacterized protein LOC129883678 [Solanum dulcamara]